MPGSDNVATGNEVTVTGNLAGVIANNQVEKPKAGLTTVTPPKKNFLKGLFSCCSRDVAQDSKKASDVLKVEQAKKAADVLKAEQAKKDTQNVENKDDKADEDKNAKDLSKALDGKTKGGVTAPVADK